MQIPFSIINQSIWKIIPRAVSNMHAQLPLISYSPAFPSSANVPARGMCVRKLNYKTKMTVRLENVTFCF